MIDVGHYGNPTSPGFVKKYVRGVRKILKKQNSKRNRQQGKRVTIDQDLPHTTKIVDSTKHYYMETRSRIRE